MIERVPRGDETPASTVSSIAAGHVFADVHTARLQYGEARGDRVSGTFVASSTPTCASQSRGTLTVTARRRSSTFRVRGCRASSTRVLTDIPTSRNANGIQALIPGWSTGANTATRRHYRGSGGMAGKPRRPRLRRGR